MSGDETSEIKGMLIEVKAGQMAIGRDVGEVKETIKHLAEKHQTLEVAFAQHKGETDAKIADAARSGPGSGRAVAGASGLGATLAAALTYILHRLLSGDPQ